jgi:hypothetical protein
VGNDEKVAVHVAALVTVSVIVGLEPVRFTMESRGGYLCRPTLDPRTGAHS